MVSSGHPLTTSASAAVPQSLKMTGGGLGETQGVPRLAELRQQLRSLAVEETEDDGIASSEAEAVGKTERLDRVLPSARRTLDRSPGEKKASAIAEVAPPQP